MKKFGLINPALCAAVACIGHTDYLVIADPGLPLPDGVEVIDLSIVRNLPRFIDVLRAVQEEFVVESYIIASEMESKSEALYHETSKVLEGLPQKQVSHEEFKQLTKKSKAIIRTGETTPYANVILVAGVNF